MQVFKLKYSQWPSEKYQVVTDLEQSKPDYFIISTVLYEYFMT